MMREGREPCEDGKPLQACVKGRSRRIVVVAAEDHPVYSCDRETLTVTRTALEPILKDLREVTEAIREELKIE